jgi:predicted porin
MKKHLIAAAVAAAVVAPAAMAQNVQMYGILSQAYSDIDTKLSVGANSATVNTTNTGTQGAQAGSRLGFRGTEDLGGGMKAGFVYELGINTDTGTGANRLGYLDLSGAFGTIRAGKVDSLTRSIYNSYTAHGNSGFAPGNTGASRGVIAATVYALDSGATVANAVSKGCGNTFAAPYSKADCDDLSSALGFGGTRVNNSIGYISPSFSGLTAQIQYGKADTDLSTVAGSATNEQLNFGISYAAGPLAIAIARDTVELTREAAGPVVTSDFTTDMIGVAYDFGVAKAFLNYTSKKYEATGFQEEKSKDTTVGVSIPLGAVVLVGSYSQGDFNDVDIDGFQLQANYNLSKRTRLYAMFGETDVSVGNASWKLDGFALGVQHSF